MDRPHEGAPRGPEQDPGGTVEPPAALSHIEIEGGRARSRMVDVGAKPATARTALARAVVEFPPGVLDAVLAGDGPKGPVEEVARVAGVLAAKGTGQTIPMCHPLGLDHVDVTFAPLDGDRLEVRCRAACTGPTGVEMEAMVGATIAALTVYDMTKALSKGIRIGPVELLEKTGGKGGTWRRE